MWSRVRFSHPAPKRPARCRSPGEAGSPDPAPCARRRGSVEPDCREPGDWCASAAWRTEGDDGLDHGEGEALSRRDGRGPSLQRPWPRSRLTVNANAESGWRSAAAWTDSGCVFVDEAGVEYHPHRFTKMFEDAVRRAGVPKIRLHDTRHTMATLALEAGVHPKVVQEQLGHSAIAVTLDTYSHVPQAIDATAPTRSRHCLASEPTRLISSMIFQGEPTSLGRLSTGTDRTSRLTACGPGVSNPTETDRRRHCPCSASENGKGHPISIVTITKTRTDNTHSPAPVQCSEIPAPGMARDLTSLERRRLVRRLAR